MLVNNILTEISFKSYILTQLNNGVNTDVPKRSSIQFLKLFFVHSNNESPAMNVPERS